VCGIVGYVGARPARELLLLGLTRLEYRGYDSAGIAVLAGDQVQAARAVGNLDALRAKLETGGAANGAKGAAEGPAVGIGHTRWATHGRVSEANAHPHFDSAGRVHVVVNGIVENYLPLKERLLTQGNVFTSETDAEVIAHVIAQHYHGDLASAVREAFAELEGHYAFVAMSPEEPETLVGARRECPLVVGRGEGEQFVASAIPAFLSETRSVQYLENGEIVVLNPQGATITTASGQEVTRPLQLVEWDQETVEKGGFESFMLKEIYEQADAVAETISGHIHSEKGVELGIEGDLEERQLAEVGRIVIVACGTSYHAGLVGRYAIEEWARVPVELDIASEYRYRNAVIGSRDLVIGISQSGETADTLAAMREARERGADVLAITNVAGSQVTRESDGVLFTQAGLEIGVAATKTFVCQVALIYLLGLRLAELRGTLPAARVAELVGELRRLPHRIGELIGPLVNLTAGYGGAGDGAAGDGAAGDGAAGDGGAELAANGSALAGAERDGDGDRGDGTGAVLAQVMRVAEEHWSKEFFLYIGRHIGLPVALEGALKLKEISYIATDAYAAGEMKHGPIALLDESTPVVCVATDSPVLEKMISNMQEVRARGAHVIALAGAEQSRVRPHADVAIAIPAVDWMLQPLLAVIPLQLLAYAIARRRGLNVDQPRNLAKTVTVE
jgi:glutamine---fructose-6-phosphate transaminase (isomerizing)